MIRLILLPTEVIMLVGINVDVGDDMMYGVVLITYFSHYSTNSTSTSTRYL